MSKLIIINIETIICNNGYLLVAYTFLLRVGCLYIIYYIYLHMEAPSRPGVGNGPGTGLSDG